MSAKTKKKVKRVPQWYEYQGRAYCVETNSKSEERLIGYDAKKITEAAAKKLPGGPVEPQPDNTGQGDEGPKE